ncbi:ribonuclease H2, subunit C [Phycomyces nitens]|nr:ribonuclease H2, subunit C [Phycomyces nitens]
MTSEASLLQTPKAHLLPFGIAVEGLVNADQYMPVDPEVDPLHKAVNEKFRTYTTVIHGRRLYGHEIPLNETIKGHLWAQEESMDHPEYDDEEDEDEDYEKKARKFSKIGNSLESFVLWKKDSAPNEKDPRLVALDSWFDIAQVIHSPVPI